MKQFLAGSATGLLLALAGWFISTSLSNAINKGANKRWFADVRTISEGVEAYRADHGECPVTVDILKLEKILEPRYLRIMPTEGFSYFSDGTSYTILATPYGRKATGPLRYPAFTFRDGAFVSWPEYMGPNAPAATRRSTDSP